MRRNVRLVLPGEYVLSDRQPHLPPQRVHHVEVIGYGPQVEVVLCFSRGSHPDREADKTAPWPTMARGIDDDVEVVPPPPKLATAWDAASGKWACRIDTEDPTGYRWEQP